MIPGWYIHETNISDGIMNEYKDKNKTEKTWVLYEKLCEFGSSLCGVIAKNDESLKKPIINNFSKFIPGSEDLKDIFSQDHITVEDFVRMYCDPMDIELDEELLWPYDWHLNL